MNDTSKLLMTVAIGGVLLGAGLSGHVPTMMKPGPEADWRERYRVSYSDHSMQYTDSGPIDLSPALAWPGASPTLQPAMFQEPLYQNPHYYGDGYDPVEVAPPRNDTAQPDADPASSTLSEDALQEAVAAADALKQGSSESSESPISRGNRRASPNSPETPGANSPMAPDTL